MDKNILVTGGAGYIATHTEVELLNRGFNVIAFDNMVNSCDESIKRVEKITGKKIKFYNADMRDRAAMEKIFSENEIDSVIHFAATVYGTPERLPLDEDCSLSTTNPYGSTKLMLETVMKDLYTSDNTWDIILLRYFNPVGAHESGLIGEDPKGIPNNLTPYIAQVACGKLKEINVFGNDYDTPDGTGVRDYIHVVDLAIGHVKAIEKVNEAGVHIYNLGTGNGYSVLDVIHAFEKACGKKLPYKICPRRAGDIAACYANADKAKRELGWVAERGIDEMCASLWKWQTMNPDGYNTNK